MAEVTRTPQLIAGPMVPDLAQAVPWLRVLQAYLDRLSSPGTRKVYEKAVREAFDWLQILDIRLLTAEHLTGYRAHLVRRAQERELSPASVALKLSALRGFFKFCRLVGVSPLTREVIDFALASYTAKVLRPYQVLTTAETERLLQSLRQEGKVRDHALLTVMLSTGLRVSEVCQVRMKHIIRYGQEKEWSLHVAQGKGRKDRIVPLSRQTWDVLRLFLRHTGRAFPDPEQAETFLFHGLRGPTSPLSTRRVQQIVAEAVHSAGITSKAITPHSLRHTYALRLLEKGASIPIVQAMLGHASIQTTQRYLDHIDQRRLREWALAAV